MLHYGATRPEVVSITRAIIRVPSMRTPVVEDAEAGIAYMRISQFSPSTPDEMRGRVSAVNGVFIGTSNEIGEVRAGFMAAWIGAVPAVVLGGIGSLWLTGLRPARSNSTPRQGDAHPPRAHLRSVPGTRLVDADGWIGDGRW